MTAKIRKRWFGNSLVNIFGGIASAGVNVVLPALVVQYFDAATFSAWSLALQIAVYVNLLSLGLQTATARAVAHVVELGSEDRLPAIFKAAESIAKLASLLASFLVLCLVLFYPLIFPSLKDDMLLDFRFALSVIGGGAVLQILAQAEMGAFQGLHRNIVFVGAQVVIKITTVLVVWLGVRNSQPMVVLATLMGLSMAALWPLMTALFGRLIPWANCVATCAVNRNLQRELLAYCGTLSVWSLSMLLVNSAGIVIVGRLDFAKAGAYTIAMTAATVVAGLLGAVMSPLMTTAAALNANDVTRARLPALLESATVVLLGCLGFLFMLLIVFHREILGFWVGDGLVTIVAPLMLLLVGAHCLRNIASPYSLMLLATGLHRRALVSALLEGGGNLFASIIFGVMYGAVGVAAGSLFGAFVGLFGTVMLNMGRTPELTPQPLKFFIRSIFVPMLVILPSCAYLLYQYVN